MAKTHPFFSPATHGFVRVAAATPVVHTADPKANADEHIALIEQAAAQGCDLVVFPELSLTGYAIDDLLMQDALLAETERQIARVAKATKGGPVAVAGAPVRVGDRLLNAAVVMSEGEIVALIPKTYLPNYREYYEKRWFAPAQDDRVHMLTFAGQRVWMGPRIVFRCENRPEFTFGVEICEDYWAPLPPSTRLALAGARILLNLSASNVLIGKADDRASCAPANRRGRWRPMCSQPRAGARAPPTWRGTGSPRSTSSARNWPRTSGSRWRTA